MLQLSGPVGLGVLKKRFVGWLVQVFDAARWSLSRLEREREKSLPSAHFLWYDMQEYVRTTFLKLL